MNNISKTYVGNTPLVRLKRMTCGRGQRAMLAKLEGNNPAGVGEGPPGALHDPARNNAANQAGDTLIEPTSGNTGIALAMAATMMGYRMILVMPEHLERRAPPDHARVRRRLVLTPKSGGMEMARDVAERMRDEGKGVMLDQFANPDNPLAHYEAPARRSGAIPRGASPISSAAWARPAPSWASRGTSRSERRDPDRRVRSLPRLQIPGIRKWPQEYLPKIYEHPRVDQLDRGEPGRCRRDDAPTCTRGRHLRRHLLGRRDVGRVAGRRAGRNAVIVTIVCDRGDRYLSTGVFPTERMTPVLAFDIETVPDVAGLRRLHDLPTPCRTAKSRKWRSSAAGKRSGTTSCRCISTVWSPSPAHCASATVSRSGHSVSPDEAEGQSHSAILRRRREIHTTARVVERRRFRSARAALSRHAARRPRRPLLGNGRRDATFRYHNTSAATTRGTSTLMDLLGLYQSRGPLDEFAQLLG